MLDGFERDLKEGYREYMACKEDKIVAFPFHRFWTKFFSSIHQKQVFLFQFDIINSCHLIDVVQ